MNLMVRAHFDCTARGCREDILVRSRKSIRCSVSTDVQQELAQRVEEAVRPHRSFLERDPEFRALKKLAARNQKDPPKAPLDALQHVVDTAREMTHGTYGALAVT